MTVNRENLPFRNDPRKEKNRNNMTKIRWIFLYALIMIKLVFGIPTSIENSTDGLKEVSALSGRMERSHDHEVVWAKIEARPCEFLDDPRFYPVFRNSVQTNVTFQETQTAYLHCSIHQFEDKVVSWIKKTNKHILTIGEYTYTADTRFKSIHLKNSDYWNLEIKDTREEDSGVYECQVNTEPKLSREIQLNIIVVEAYISEGPILYIKSGNPANLTCHVKDQVGTAFLFWYYNGRVLDADEKKRRDIDIFTHFRPITISRLFFAKAKLSDSGKYSCQPSYAKPANITLQVLNDENSINTGYKNGAVSELLEFMSFIFTRLLFICLNHGMTGNDHII